MSRLVLLAALALATTATAQTYPTKPVRIIVPFAPGGSVDLIARMLAQRLSERLGGSFVVDNRAGGGSNIGAEAAARAAPDGYTLFMASTAQAVNATLYPKPGYDLMKDFAPVSLVAVNPSVVLVHPSLPVKTVKELVALAKGKPGALSYASSGSGSSSHLAAELFKISTGTDLVHVPYKGAGPALTALLGGQVELLITITAGASQYIKAGKLRALAVTSDRRTPGLPDVPTMKEAGVPGYEVYVWTGLLAPAATPPQILAVLNKEAMASVNDLAKRLSELEAVPSPTTPQQFTAFMRNDIAKWAPVVKKSGAKVE